MRKAYIHDIYYVYMKLTELRVRLGKKEVVEILERDVSGFGSGSHAILPKKHAGKKAIILIIK